ncbi:hypothetical protein LCGC14_0342280 [marine sediment metagenome]|uniref:Uncharacterized protein n=1 Tax=marine sediment metagenome TaxID=412755 RepID=A0A0F9W0L7_9ZZZZ
MKDLRKELGLNEVAKSITLELTKIKVEGQATIKLYDGSVIGVMITPSTLDLEQLITEEILNRCVNDGGYGCDEITEATLYFSAVYSDGSCEVDKFISETTTSVLDQSLCTKGV